MSQFAVPASSPGMNLIAAVNPGADANWHRVDLERGRGADAMQVRASFGRRWGASVLGALDVPQSLLQATRPAPLAPAGQPIAHVVGEGHGFVKVGAGILGLAGFCCGYGFSTMAGEQLLLSLPSQPFNPDGHAQRTLATGLVGFNLPFGIAGLAVGALVGAGLGALLDACVE